MYVAVRFSLFKERPIEWWVIWKRMFSSQLDIFSAKITWDFEFWPKRCVYLQLMHLKAIFFFFCHTGVVGFGVFGVGGFYSARQMRAKKNFFNFWRWMNFYSRRLFSSLSEKGHLPVSSCRSLCTVKLLFNLRKRVAFFTFLLNVYSLREITHWDLSNEK